MIRYVCGAFCCDSLFAWFLPERILEMCELNLITAEKEKAIWDRNRLVEAPDFSLIYVGKTREAMWVWGFCFEHYDKEKQSNCGEMMCVIAAHKITEYIVALYWGHRASLGSPPLDFAARQWPCGLLTRSLIYWTYNRWQTAIGCRKKLIPFWSPYPNVSEGKLFLR